MSLTCVERSKIWGFWGAIVLLIIGFFLLVTLLPLSVEEVNHDEYGIHWRDVLARIDSDEPLEEGRHILKPDSHVYTYPSKNVLSEQSPVCMTKDGVEVVVTVAVQYIYQKNEVIQAFNEFGDSENSQNFVELTIVDAVRDACSEVTADKFFLERGNVERLIVDSVSDHLIKSNSHVRSGGSTQLENYRYNAPTYGRVIQEIQSTEQQIQVLLNQRAQQVTEAQTVLRQSEVQKETQVEQAEIEASAILFQAHQDALAEETFWEETASAYQLAFNNYKKGNPSATFADFVNGYLMQTLLSKFDAPVVSLSGDV